jgi:hypothetical protein
MAKRVILHIGFHKTGSSALQVFLATNADRLAAAGIGYPYPDSEHIVTTGGCSGNAVQVLYREGFMDGFNQRLEIPAQRMSEAYFDVLAKVIEAVPQHTALVSGELLSAGVDEALLHSCIKNRSSQNVEIVCFVRDPFDFVFSSWRQGLKDSRGIPTFANYLNGILDGTQKAPSMLDSFKSFHSLGLPLTVLNFDHHRRNIVDPFLRAIGAESLIGQVEMTTAREANRSLTPSEACLADLVNQKINDSTFSATFVRTALDRDNPKSRKYYNRAQHQRVLERFAGTIALINEYLPDDQKLATEVRDCPDADCVVEPEDVVLLLELVQKRAAARAGSQPPSGAASHFNAPVLPPDFDSEAYLFHNPDVAAAGMDAAHHYLAHGWREGRRYRLF